MFNNDELCEYCKNNATCQIDNISKCEEHILFSLRESVFHMSDEEAHAMVDTFIDHNAYMLSIHSREEWYALV